MSSSIIREIESTDDYWGPAFRYIYEDGGHVELLEKLEDRIKDHDIEIEKLCRFYYQDFIESIRDLIQVRTQAKLLYSDVNELDSKLQSCTNGLISKGEQLVQGREVERNIASAIEKMTLCLPVMNSYSRLLKQVQSKKYYPALKTLQHLEHVLLSTVNKFKFCSDILKNIPKLKQTIREASMAELTDFLENIRKCSPQIGCKAQQQTQRITARDLSALVKHKKQQLDSGSFTDLEESCIQDLIDFKPLYRCLHIHTVLGAKAEFIQYYRDQRQHQARLVLIANATMHESIQHYINYLNGILGFFIVEDHILGTAGGLVTKEWIQDLWGMAVAKVASTLRKNTSLSTDPQIMLDIKQQIVLFNTTLKYHGLNEGPLHGLLQEMAEHYTEVLMRQWITIFREILHNEAFYPIKVENQNEYNAVLNSFPFNADNYDKDHFPRELPFSSMVPAIYGQVKEFIYACLKFSSGLGLSPSQRASHVRHSASLLLTRSFTGCLSSLFQRPSLALLQVVQITIDMQYLENSTVYLQQFIGNITGAEYSIPEQNVMFQTARNDAEQQICDKLKNKLQEFFDLESYDWLLVESTGQASSYVTDMINFLQSMFSTLTNLPEKVAIQSCKSACQYIAQSIHDMIVSPNNKQISMGALHQINLDVIQCEQFAASEPVPGIKDTELLAFFSSLRQLFDLVMSWDWATYLHDVGLEEGKYPLVSPTEAAMLLEKIKEADHRSSVFSVLKKSERDRKKLLDTVLKQLRQLPQFDEPAK